MAGEFKVIVGNDMWGVPVTDQGTAKRLKLEYMEVLLQCCIAMQNRKLVLEESAVSETEKYLGNGIMQLIGNQYVKNKDMQIAYKVGSTKYGYLFMAVTWSNRYSLGSKALDAMFAEMLNEHLNSFH